LEQLKVLADPLRLRMLEAFALAPVTTKQVAERIGEKPTKLYHHVDALAAAGLVRLVRKQQKRGTVEKYYQAVARVFEVDQRVLLPAGDPEATWQRVGAELLERAAGEIRGARELAEGDCGVVLQLLVTATPEEVGRLRAQLLDWVETTRKSVRRKRPKSDAPTETWRATLAFVPLPAQSETSD
jgi:DNA-binding transcriptional ArsR family regulator